MQIGSVRGISQNIITQYYTKVCKVMPGPVCLLYRVLVVYVCFIYRETCRFLTSELHQNAPGDRVPTEPAGELTALP